MALVVGLTLSFLAPVAVTAFLIATDREGTDDERTMADGRSTGSERAGKGGPATTKGPSRDEPPSATRTGRSTGARREGTRTSDGSER